MKNFLLNFSAIIWFFGVLLGTIVFLFFCMLMVAFTSIRVMLESGFSTPAMGVVFCFMGSLIFAITGWVPAFRRCYYKLPWLYPLTTIMMMDFFILAIAEVIVSQGFSVVDETRHTMTVVIMLIQIIACRAAMSIYIKKNPLLLHKYDVSQ